MRTATPPEAETETVEADRKTPGPTRAHRIRAGGGTAAVILAGTALIAAHATRYGQWIMDDAAITFAYSRSIVDGLGPVLQPGADPVEAFSNPTWMLLLAFGKLVGLFDEGTLFGVPDYVLFPKALALVCCAGMLTLFYIAVKPITSRPRLVTLVAGAGLAAVPSFVIWTFSGLENSLYALVVVALAVVIQRAVLADRLLTWKVAVATGLLVSAAALTRPDGLIYAAAYPAVVLIHLDRIRLGASVRAVLFSAAGFIVVFGGYLVWRWNTFHLLVANTVVAKAQKPPGFEDLGKASELVAYAGWIVVLVVALCLTAVMLRPSRLRSGLVAPVVTLALAVAAYCVLPADWMGELRFATPVWALGALVGAVAVVETMRLARRRGRIAIGAGLVIGIALSLAQFQTSSEEYRAAVKTPLCVVAERDGRTLNGLADRLGLDRGSAAVIDLGGTSLTSRLDLIDLGGLGDARTARFVGADDWAGLRDHVFNEAKPSFITTIGSWDRTIGFPTDPRFERDYATVYHGPEMGGINYSYNYVGFWVRKDLLPNAAKLDELRTYARGRLDPIMEQNVAAPRRTCGPELRRGQTS